MNQELSRLLSNACQGDSTAIDALLAGIRPRLEGMIRCRLGFAPVDWSEVEDLIQEVQVALVPSLSRFEGAGASGFLAFLSGIVRHKVQDHFRKMGCWTKGRGGSGMGRASLSARTGEEIFASLQDSLTSPSSRVARAELFDLVVEQVSFLPERQREAVLMAFMDGLNSREIGEALGIERPAAAMLVLRGVKNLRRLWRKNRERWA